MEIHQAIITLPPSVWKERKLIEVKKLIKACAGLKLQLNADRGYGISGESLKIKLAAVHQSDATIEVRKINTNEIDIPLKPNTVFNRSIEFLLNEKLSAPYWLLKKVGTFKVQDNTLIGQAETPPLQLPVEVRDK